MAAKRNSKQRVSKVRIAKMHEALMCLPHTFATYIGQKETSGRRTKKSALICLVHKKVPKEYLLQDRRVPTSFKWNEAKKARRLQTDVKVTHAKFVPQAAVAGPGDALASNNTRGTVGVAIRHPTLGDCISTAGHFIEMAQSPSTVDLLMGNQTVTARARAPRINDTVDYALVFPPANVPCDNLLNDVRRIGPVFDPTSVDVGKRVFVVDRNNGVRIPTICRGVHASVNLPEQPLKDCILTDLVTHAGQSGTCLIDEQFRVWGLLRGRLGADFSVFMPVRHLLRDEGATLL
jgi:hypothetical protein